MAGLKPKDLSMTTCKRERILLGFFLSDRCSLADKIQRDVKSSRVSSSFGQKKISQIGISQMHLEGPGRERETLNDENKNAELK